MISLWLCNCHNLHYLALSLFITFLILIFDVLLLTIKVTYYWMLLFSDLYLTHDFQSLLVGLFNFYSKLQPLSTSPFLNLYFYWFFFGCWLMVVHSTARLFEKHHDQHSKIAPFCLAGSTFSRVSYCKILLVFILITISLLQIN